MDRKVNSSHPAPTFTEPQENRSASEEEGIFAPETPVRTNLSQQRSITSSDVDETPSQELVEDNFPTTPSRLTPRSRLRVIQGRCRRGRRGEHIAVAIMQQQGDECRTFFSLQRSQHDDCLEEHRESNRIMRDLTDICREDSRENNANMRKIIAGIESTQAVLVEMLKEMKRENRNAGMPFDVPQMHSPAPVVNRGEVSPSASSVSTYVDEDILVRQNMSRTTHKEGTEVVNCVGAQAFDPSEDLFASQGRGLVSERAKRVARKRLPYSP